MDELEYYESRQEQEEYDKYHRKLEDDYELEMYTKEYRKIVDEFLSNLNENNPFENMKELHKIKEYRDMLYKEPISDYNETEWIEILDRCLTLDREQTLDCINLNYLLRTVPYYNEEHFYNTLLEYAKQNEEKYKPIIQHIEYAIGLFNKRLKINLDEELKKQLYNCLLKYFKDVSYKAQFQHSITKILNGHYLSEPILFNGNQSQLVDFFKNLLDNNLIDSSKADLNRWLCNNFNFTDGNSVKPFNEETIKTSFKNRRIPKQRRICQDTD